MHGYILYQITKQQVDDMNRRAEMHRMVADARRERRADRRLAARPGTVLQHLRPAVLTGSRRRQQTARAEDSRRGSADPRDELFHCPADRGGPDRLVHVEVAVCAGQLGNPRVRATARMYRRRSARWGRHAGRRDDPGPARG